MAAFIICLIQTRRISSMRKSKHGSLVFQTLDFVAGPTRAVGRLDGGFLCRFDSAKLPTSFQCRQASIAMVDEPNPTKPARKRKKRRRKPREEFVDYIVAIEDWNWSYSLSLNTERHAIDPYHEFRHVQIRGRLLHPKGLKTERAEITLLPSYDMLPDARKEREPRCVVSLDVYGERIAGLVSIPVDAVPPILQMLIGGCFRFASMRGPPLRYRQTLCNSFRLEMTMDEDDMPAIETPT
jgi:hypothetical protein